MTKEEEFEIWGDEDGLCQCCGKRGKVIETYANTVCYDNQFCAKWAESIYDYDKNEAPMVSPFGDLITVS